MIQAIRIAGYLAGTLSFFTIVLCLLIVPSLLIEIASIRSELDSEMMGFRSLSNDIWSRMMEMGGGSIRARARRQAVDAYYFQQQVEAPPLPLITDNGSPPTAGGPSRPTRPAIDNNPGGIPSPVDPILFPPSPISPPRNEPNCQCSSRQNDCPAGTPGEAGENGSDGEQGPDGPDGLDGLDGEDVKPLTQSAGCTTCPQGPAGERGPSGRRGPRGMRGANGQGGQNGRPGSPGSPGSIGDTGDAGPAGDNGRVGLVGSDSQNVVGTPGEKGPDGEAGAEGDSGLDGNNADDGASGAPGAKGPQGRVGQPGNPGGNGSLGFEGTPGEDAEYCALCKPRRRQQVRNTEPEDEEYSAWKRHGTKKL